jgi:hypothetical protein
MSYPYVEQLVLQHDLASRWLESGARNHLGLLFTGLFEAQSGD